MIRKSILMSAAALGALTAPAFAETGEAAAQQVEVIRVTTQFREQSLADVPVNVTAFDAELIDRLDIRNLEDMAAFTPGLVVQEQSPNNTGYSLRGITTDSGDTFAESRVAVFQDGVSITRSRGSYVELFDIERLEVAKGPQPTLFGRGALIGGINIIQRKAEDTSSAQVYGATGNLDQTEIGGYINARVTDGAGLRISGVRRSRDGHIDNLLGGTLQGRDVTALRAVFSAELVEGLDLDLIANWQVDTGPGTSFKSGTLAPAGGDTNPFTPAGMFTFPGFENDMGLGLDRTVWGLTGLVDYRINDALTLSSITGYREFDSVEVFDPIGGGISFINFAEDARGRQLSQEFRLSYDAGGRISAVGGLAWFYEAGTQRIPLIANEATVQAFFVNQGAFGNPAGIAALLGVPVSAITSLSNPFGFSIAALAGGQGFVPLGTYQEESANSGRTEAFDVFGEITLQATDRLSFTAGVRYTGEDKRTSGYGAALAGPNRVNFAPFLVLPGTPNGATQTQEASFDDFTWRLVAAYEVSDSLNTWISYARGRRPDVLALDTGSPTFFSTAPAELVDSYEAGAFLTLDRGTVSGSIFYSEYENFQSSVFDPFTGQFGPSNAGEATQYGLELQASYAVTDRVEMFATYAYNMATFNDTSNGQAQALAGNRFRYSPEHSASVGVRAELFSNNLGSLSFLPAYSWQSHIFFDNNNQRFAGVRQDAYGLLRARLRFDAADERWYGEVFGSNLTDEQYLIDAGNTGAAFGLPTFIAGSPRLYGVRLGVNF
ncbi:MAG: TonB-dependent receptor [Caulobacterales bacterium]|uniref:TonB-dependent receptor n=1 Tax=Glycocaulis sp. TaxID=1969725 RepID=UPI003FA124DB